MPSTTRKSHIVFLLLFCILLGAANAQSVNARNLLKLARSYASQNDWERAKDYANQALKEEAGYLDALYMRAFAHRELKEHGKAAADFNEVIRQDPNYLPTYGALADMYIQMEDYEKADEVFNRLSRAPDGAKWANYYRGVVAYLEHDLDKAEKFWREVLNKDVNFDLAHHNMGAIWLARGNASKALLNFREALSKQPEKAMYRFHVAWALEKNQQADAAREMLKSIMNENADDQQFWLLARGLDRLISGKTEDAAAVLKTVSEQHPANLDVWILLGRAHLALSNEEEARQALEKAKELDPAFQEIDVLMGKLPPKKPDAPDSETTEKATKEPETGQEVP